MDRACVYRYHGLDRQDRHQEVYGVSIVPQRPKHLCNRRPCGRLTRNRFCDEHATEHQKQSDAKRLPSSQRGYNARWRKARLAYLRRHPMCVACDAEGHARPATVVDHIVPHKGDQDLMWDEGNWRALCKRCHDRATALYDGGFGREVKPRE